MKSIPTNCMLLPLGAQELLPATQPLGKCPSSQAPPPSLPCFAQGLLLFASNSYRSTSHNSPRSPPVVCLMPNLTTLHVSPATSLDFIPHSIRPMVRFNFNFSWILGSSDSLDCIPHSPRPTTHFNFNFSWILGSSDSLHGLFEWFRETSKYMGGPELLNSCVSNRCSPNLLFWVFLPVQVFKTVFPAGASFRNRCS